MVVAVSRSTGVVVVVAVAAEAVVEAAVVQ